MIEYNEKKAVQTEEPDIKLPKLFRRYRPKYLKKPEKRKSLRALTCFALIFAALTASVAGTYAKYISDPVTIPSFSVEAAKFACEVKDLTIDDKAKYGLTDKDVVVTAFTVSNEKNGVLSDVDLSVDVNLIGLTGSYVAQCKIAGATIEFETEQMAENVNFITKLKSKLIIYSLNDDGTLNKLENQPTPISTISSSESNLEIPNCDIMPIAGGYSPLPWYADCHNEWKEAFTISCDTTHKYVGVIIIDTDVSDDQNNKLTFAGSDLTLSAGSNNLVVTVNQAKASA